MDEENAKLAEAFVSKSYIQQGLRSLHARSLLLRSLLAQRRLPDHGWDDGSIEGVLSDLALMDSNNFVGAVGFGEREARIYSPLVRQRHWGLGHGIGRSGDVAAEQPKAAGSSLLARLTHALALDALKIAGGKATKVALTLPVATGMALSLCLASFRQQRPKALHVIVTRADQKTALKAIAGASLHPVIVENILEGEEVRTNMAGIEEAIEKSGGPDQVLCVLTTTSCFAPRAVDRVVDVARLCKQLDIPHLINNAYGVQSRKCMNMVNEACLQGRVDMYVQSTDKNFMVPVGGSIVASPSPENIVRVGKVYPGRASASPLVDLFITLLSLGADGWRRVLAERKMVYAELKKALEQVAEEVGEHLIETPHNDISFALTVNQCRPSATMLGSMLFSRNVSGTRVVEQGHPVSVGGVDFASYGAHIDNYPHAYVNAAAAIGLSADQIPVFAKRLVKTIREKKKKG